MSNEIFLITFMILLVVVSIFPIAFRRFKVPGVIALLIAGMVIGPNGIDLIRFLADYLSFLGGTSDAIAESATFFVNSLGSLGLVFLMTLAGLEADFQLIRLAKRPVILLSVLTFIIPAVSGFLIYQYFDSTDFSAKLLYASLFASHSVGIVFPIIRELKLSKTRFGAAVLISTVITDVASIVLLAVSFQVKRLDSANAMNGVHKTLSVFDYLPVESLGSSFIAIFIAIVIFYIAIALFVVNRLGGKLFTLLNPSEDVLISLLIMVIVGTVLCGEFLGINLVVGAFVAGLALSLVLKNHPIHAEHISGRLEGIGYGFLIPFLFVSIGMKSDFTMLFKSADNLLIIGLTIGGLVLSKVFSGWISMRFSGFGNAAGIVAGFMTVPQLSATLAAASIGKDMGILSENFFNAVVIMSIVTTLPIPNIVRWIIEKAHLSFEESASTEPQYNLPDKELDEFL